MDFNLATTVSLSSAATCAALSALGGYLSRGPASRHFRYAAAAGLAGGLYCVTDAVLAGRVGAGATAWWGRVGSFAVCMHGAAWVAFLAAWDRRPFSRLERVMIVASLVAGLVSFVPGWVAYDTISVRTHAVLGITYSDPDFGPLGVPVAVLFYVTHVLATVAAARMSRHNQPARAVAVGLAVFCVVIPVDTLSSMHVLDLPYLADPATAFVLLSIGSVVVRDAAESAEKSAELERTRVALAERDNLAALGQLAAVVAHEVRNPVAVIFGALTTLQRTERGEPDAKLLAIVGEEAARLKQLVDRLLDAVRPFELQYSRSAAKPLIESAVSQARAGAEVPSTEVELTSVPNEEVECDEVLLVQAIANLVQNALTATGRRSPVRVAASVEEPSHPSMLRVEIVDDGEGVPREARERLFTPFFTTRATGTGLGLALVKRIAGAHGGTVEYAAPEGGGASFVLRVPLRARDATPRRLIGADVR